MMHLVLLISWSFQCMVCGRWAKKASAFCVFLFVPKLFLAFYSILHLHAGVLLIVNHSSVWVVVDGQEAVPLFLFLVLEECLAVVVHHLILWHNYNPQSLAIECQCCWFVLLAHMLPLLMCFTNKMCLFVTACGPISALFTHKLLVRGVFTSYLYTKPHIIWFNFCDIKHC